MIGNAYVDPAVIPRTVRPFYNFGLIEQEQVEMLKPMSKAVAEQVAANNGTLAKQVRSLKAIYNSLQPALLQMPMGSDDCYLATAYCKLLL